MEGAVSNASPFTLGETVAQKTGEVGTQREVLELEAVSEHRAIKTSQAPGHMDWVFDGSHDDIHHLKQKRSRF